MGKKLWAKMLLPTYQVNTFFQTLPSKNFKTVEKDKRTNDHFLLLCQLVNLTEVRVSFPPKDNFLNPFSFLFTLTSLVGRCEEGSSFRFTRLRCSALERRRRRRRRRETLAAAAHIRKNSRKLNLPKESCANAFCAEERIPRSLDQSIDRFVHSLIIINCCCCFCWWNASFFLFFWGCFCVCGRFGLEENQPFVARLVSWWTGAFRLHLCIVSCRNRVVVVVVL